MDDKDDNGWGKWQNHVLAELKRLNSSIDKWTDKNTEEHADIHKSVSENKGEIKALKVKASIWGLFGGSLPAIATILGFLVYKLFG
jgi:hypothetical protein